MNVNQQTKVAIDVSVILVNYNTLALTTLCLNSIYGQTENIRMEVLVVDNNSNDGSQEVIRNSFPQVQLIENSENIGFGRANNVGLAHAKGKYIFFLNTDTVLLNNAVKILFDFVENHLSLAIGAVGGVLLDGNGTPTHSSGHFMKLGEPIEHQLLGFFTKKHVFSNFQKEMGLYSNTKPYVEVDYVTGADLFISRAILDEMGGFDPNFFMYFEESDLQFRMHTKGYRNYIIQGPEIIHYQGSSDSKPGYLPSKRIMNDRSMFYYFKKRTGIFEYFFFRLGYFLVKLPLLLDKRVPFADRLRYVQSLLN